MDTLGGKGLFMGEARLLLGNLFSQQSNVIVPISPC